ncbi:MAG: hypothetical protein AAFV25_27815 [Bacteroidota bacterium]
MNLFYPKMLLVLLLSSWMLPSQAQVKYSNEFLSLGIGARAQAMSTAQVASTEDVLSTFWNPAGLVYLDAPLQLVLCNACKPFGVHQSEL